MTFEASQDPEHATTGRPVLRFAPSPNGELHLGHAYSALFTDEAARALGGRFLLRIEDIDTTRCRAAFMQGIFDDLRWLGLAWEEPVRVQSAHLADYRAAQDRLSAHGLLYPCFCSRKRWQAGLAERADWPRDPDGVPLYPGTCRMMPQGERERRRAAGEPFALRLDMARALEAAGGPLSRIEEGVAPDGMSGRRPVTPERWGDVVLARKDIGTSYHIAVVVDDALQGITHVTRGLDLFHASDIHRLLQVLLDLPEPRYRHHGLIGGPDGRKLSKRCRDTSLKSLRAAGATLDDIRGELGFSPSRSATEGARS